MTSFLFLLLSSAFLTGTPLLTEPTPNSCDGCQTARYVTPPFVAVLIALFHTLSASRVPGAPAAELGSI